MYVNSLDLSLNRLLLTWAETSVLGRFYTALIADIASHSQRALDLIYVRCLPRPHPRSRIKAMILTQVDQRYLARPAPQIQNSNFERISTTLRQSYKRPIQVNYARTTCETEPHHPHYQTPSRKRQNSFYC